MVPQTHVPVPRPSTLQTGVVTRVVDKVKMVEMESKDGGIAPELGCFTVTFASRPFINCQHQKNSQPSPSNRHRMLAR